MARQIDINALISAFHRCNFELDAPCIGCEYNDICSKLDDDILKVLKAYRNVVNGWNSTAKCQPDRSGIYLARLSDGTYRILYYAMNLHAFDAVSFSEERPGWCELMFTEDTYYEFKDVTHWRLLPEPPKDLELQSE